MAVLVLQPERLVKQHNLESFPVNGEKRNSHQAEDALTGKTAFDFVLNERLPFFCFRPRMEPITDVEQCQRGEDRNESFHTLAMLTAERQDGLSGQPGEAAHDQGENPAQMDVA